jgi:hypothetical protein
MVTVVEPRGTANWAVKAPALLILMFRRTATHRK